MARCTNHLMKHSALPIHTVSASYSTRGGGAYGVDVTAHLGTAANTARTTQVSSAVGKNPWTPIFAKFSSKRSHPVTRSVHRGRAFIFNNKGIRTGHVKAGRLLYFRRLVAADSLRG